MHMQKKHIDEIFARNSEDLIRCFTELYRLLKQDELSAPELLQYIMQIDISPQNEEMAEKNKKLLFDKRRQDCREMSRLIVERLSNLNEDAVVFYKRLWNHISSSCYVDDEDRGFSMFAMSYSIRMPYNKIDEEEQMSEVEFRNVTRNIYPSILKGIQIIDRRGGLQRTQVAAALLREMNKLETEVERTVFWAQIMNFIEDDEQEEE